MTNYKALWNRYKKTLYINNNKKLQAPEKVMVTKHV
jgi:hypothetical protein